MVLHHSEFRLSGVLTVSGIWKIRQLSVDVLSSNLIRVARSFVGGVFVRHGCCFMQGSICILSNSKLHHDPLVIRLQVSN